MDTRDNAAAYELFNQGFIAGNDGLKPDPMFLHDTVYMEGFEEGVADAQLDDTDNPVYNDGK